MCRFRTFISVAFNIWCVVAVLPEVDKIRAKRRMLGLTQGELAGLVDVSRTSMSKLENGLADLGYGKVKRIFDELERLERERGEALGLEGVFLWMVHSVPIEYVAEELPLDGVLARMVEMDYSQFPVWKNYVAVGSVTEKIVNRTIYERGFEEAMSMRVSEVMGPPFPVLDIRTPLRLAIPLLQECQGVLTSQGGKVTGIVTNIDVGKGYEAAVNARED